MKEKELWDLTVEALEEFYSIPAHERTISPEETAEELLKGCVAVAPQELVFARECASGVVRFEKLCDGALKGYCRHCHRHKKSDRYSMLLMAYVLIFRYRELGGHKVRELFYNCTDTGCIAEYLDYMLNAEAVTATAMPLWLQSYDIGFLESVVMKNLRDIRADAYRDVAEWYRARTEISVVLPHSAPSGSPTSEDLSLGKKPSSGGSYSPGKKKGRLPLPALESTPPPPPGAVAAREVRNYQHPENEVDIQQRVFTTDGRLKLPPKDVRDMLHTLPEPRMPPIPVMDPPPPPPRKPLTKPVGFSFQTNEREHRYCASVSPAMDEDQRMLQASPEVHPFNPPKPPTEPIRINTAALLKEVHTHQTRKQAELEDLRNKEACPHDASSYERWREQERLKEEQKKELDIIQRHLDALQTEENVRAKREEYKETRLKLNKEMRETKKQELERKERAKQRQLEAQQCNVQYTRETNQSMRRAAVEKHVMKKNEVMHEVKKELMQIKDEVRAKEEALQAERATVIQEIKRLRERIKRHQIVWAESNRHAAWERPKLQEVFLDSMSIMELRDELAQVKEHYRKEAEERRRQIVEQKEKDKANKQQLASMCEAERRKIRNNRSAARAAVKNNREVVKAAQQAVECDRMLALHERLEAKREMQREELARLREMERLHLNEVLLRAEDFHVKEQRRWEQEERSHIKRVTTEQAEYAEKTKRRSLH